MTTSLDKPVVWFRRAAVGLLCLVTAWTAGALLLRARFDEGRAKALAIDWMQAHHQRRLRIEGPVRLGLFPRLEVRLADVHLGDRLPAETAKGKEREAVPQPGETASLEEVRAGLGLWALLRGEVEIDRLSARGVMLDLRRDAKGRSNLDDFLPSPTVLAPGPDQPQTAAPQRPPAGPLRWDVRNIALRELRVRLRDEAALLDGELVLPSLETGPLADATASLLSLQAQVRLRQPAFEGELKLAAQFTPDLAGAAIRWRALDLGYEGDTPWAGAVRARLTADDLGWRMADQAIDLHDLNLSLSGVTPGGLKLSDSRLSATQIHYDAPAQTLQLNALSAQLQGVLKGGTPSSAPRPPADRHWKFELDWPLLGVSARALQGSPIRGRLTLDGAGQTLAATFQSAAPQGQFKAIVLPAFETVFAQEGQGRRLNGLLRTQLTLEPDAAALALDQIDGQFKLQEPGLQPLGLTLRGRVQADAQRARWNLEGRGNDSHFETGGHAIYATTPPQVQVQARLEALDLDRLLGPVLPAASAPKAGAVTEPDRIDLSPLRALNGQLKLRIDTLTHRAARLDALNVDASLDTGILRVSSLTGQAWGGRLEASGLADARASRVALKSTATGVDIQRLLRDLSGQAPPLTGTARLTLDLDTAGRSAAEMRSRLQGTASLQVRDGALQGVNLVQRLRQSRAAPSPSTPDSPSAAPALTPFKELNARVALADGIAGVNTLDIRTPVLQLLGEGWIDLDPRRLDLVLRASVLTPPRGTDAGELASLRGAVVPVRVSGPLDKLAWQVDAEALLGPGAPPTRGGASPGPSPSRLNDKLRGLIR